MELITHTVARDVKRRRPGNGRKSFRESLTDREMYDLLHEGLNGLASDRGMRLVGESEYVHNSDGSITATGRCR
jgi:hypothetical protein